MIYNERLELVKRAAVGYDNLTPRPNVEWICKQNDMEYDIIFGSIQRERRSKKEYKGVDIVDCKDKKVSTEMYFECLLDKLGQVFNLMDYIRL